VIVFKAVGRTWEEVTEIIAANVRRRRIAKNCSGCPIFSTSSAQCRPPDQTNM